MVALLAGPALAGGVGKAVAIAYGAPLAAREITSFFNTQFHTMKASDNDMVAQTGRVLEATSLGYGVGYIGSVAIIAAGQLILGNPLGAVGTVGSAAILANPIAATCAAAGAIYYGYSALSEDERTELLESVAHGLAVGTQLIRSIIEYFIAEMKKALTSDTLTELKAMVAEYAATFGSNIADITRTLVDKVQSSLGQAYDGAIHIGQSAGGALAAAATSGTALAGKTFGQISNLISGQPAATEEPVAILPPPANNPAMDQPS